MTTRSARLYRWPLCLRLAPLACLGLAVGGCQSPSADTSAPETTPTYSATAGSSSVPPPQAIQIEYVPADPLPAVDGFAKT